jgi:hypothetical protein
LLSLAEAQSSSEKADNFASFILLTLSLAALCAKLSFDHWMNLLGFVRVMAFGVWRILVIYRYQAPI